ncbi:uncharacterized protein LOC127246544 [Andrographis paniculata]|uniref:uncharacterized protein LOC127246544 n=1 Tax=Andrographis paniculata TaxID=175694 RepID=UPI0021E92A06|nr:uncharacterized protein LOC127246544 [Andrographis paniculata]
MASGAAADGGSLTLDSIPIVDLRLLSQSELYSLSLCSSTAFDPSRCDDVVIPKIDRSVFNESAGSRKQTYSRLRLAPPSESSSSSTPRRRTPHLRPTAATFPQLETNDSSDPENVDNSQIVSLLKKLFVADLNGDELVPVNIDSMDSLPAQHFPTLPHSSQAISHPSGIKRKRGRPRRNEIVGSSGGSAPVGNVAGDADRFPAPTEVFVHERMEEDRDRNILNKDGVAVDLVALGTIEHPYVEHIRQRTEGLTTDEHLFAFLAGLDGEWNSRRMKKRIIDADVFGAALPVGWKLSLTIKKNSGQSFVHCRRYISPSGLHFVTCKGVSSYLLSLHGVQDASIPDSSQPYVPVRVTDKLTPIRGPDPAVKDERRKENVVSYTSSSVIDSTPVSLEKQVLKSTEDFPKDGVGEILQCDNSNIAFGHKDELFQHQISHQGKRRITDGVIIKDGKFECQFCHKTFDERRRYNGHVGTHVRCQTRIAGESPAVNVGATVRLSSFGDIRVQDNSKLGLLNFDNRENMCSPGSKDDGNVQYLKEANCNSGVNAEATDVVSKTDQCEVADVILPSDSDKKLCPNDSSGGIIAEGLKNVDAIENSSRTQLLEKCVVSKDSLLGSNKHGVESGTVQNDCISGARNKAEIDQEKMSIDVSAFSFHGDNPSTSGSVLSKVDIGSSVNVLPRSQDENKFVTDIVPNLTSECKVYETCRFGICENGYPGADDTVGRYDEVQPGICSVKPSGSDHDKVSKKSNGGVSTSLSEEPVVQNHCESRIAALFGHGSVCDLNHKDDEVYERGIKVSEIDQHQTSGNGDSADPFFDSHIGLNSYSFMGTLPDMQLGVCSVPSSTATKQFFQDNSMMRIFDGASKAQGQGQPGGVSLSRSDNVPANHSKPNAIENAGEQELNLFSGNHPAQLFPDSSRVEEKRYQTSDNIQSVEGFNIQSTVHRTYGDETILGTRNSDLFGDLNQGRLHHGPVPDSLFGVKIGSNFNAAHTGGRMGPSNQNFMVAFENGSSQPGDCGAADATWRTGHENVFQGDFEATASMRLPSSTNIFGTFGLTSDKVLNNFLYGQENSYGVGKNYKLETDMLRSGRSEPVEYPFLDNESSNFSYTGNTEQHGLDPSIWQGKDALMPPYTSHSNQYYFSPDPAAAIGNGPSYFYPIGETKKSLEWCNNCGLLYDYQKSLGTGSFELPNLSVKSKKINATCMYLYMMMMEEGRQRIRCSSSSKEAIVFIPLGIVNQGLIHSKERVNKCKPKDSLADSNFSV